MLSCWLIIFCFVNVAVGNYLPTFSFDTYTSFVSGNAPFTDVSFILRSGYSSKRLLFEAVTLPAVVTENICLGD